MTNSTLTPKQGSSYAIFQVDENGEPIRHYEHRTAKGKRYHEILADLEKSLDTYEKPEDDQLWREVGDYSQSHFDALQANELSPLWRHVVGYFQTLDKEYGGKVPADQTLRVFKKARREFERRKESRAFHFDYDTGLDLLNSNPHNRPTVWGDAEVNHIPWIRGEPAMIFGFTGAGKTTLTHNLLMGLAGISGYGTLLGLPVEPLAPGESILYLALDRPDNARRSLDRFLRRMTPGEREHFARVVKAQAVLPHEIRDNPDAFTSWVANFPGNVRVLIIEHAKDVWGDLAQTARATLAGEAIRSLNAEYGIDSLTLNHIRGVGGRTYVAGIDDSYGGTNFTNPMGTINSIERKGELVTFKQWKEPAGLVMPKIKAKGNPDTGRYTVKGAGLDALLSDGRWHGIAELARAESGMSQPDAATRARVRRALSKLEAAGNVEVSDDDYGRKWRYAE